MGARFTGAQDDPYPISSKRSSKFHESPVQCFTRSRQVISVCSLVCTIPVMQPLHTDSHHTGSQHTYRFASCMQLHAGSRRFASYRFATYIQVRIMHATSRNLTHCRSYTHLRITSTNGHVPSDLKSRRPTKQNGRSFFFAPHQQKYTKKPRTTQK